MLAVERHELLHCLFVHSLRTVLSVLGRVFKQEFSSKRNTHHVVAANVLLIRFSFPRNVRAGHDGLDLRWLVLGVRKAFKGAMTARLRVKVQFLRTSYLLGE